MLQFVHGCEPKNMDFTFYIVYKYLCILLYMMKIIIIIIIVIIIIIIVD